MSGTGDAVSWEKGDETSTRCALAQYPTFEQRYVGGDERDFTIQVVNRLLPGN